MREYLATSSIDLLATYTEFRASPAASDIDRHEFSRLPLGCIHEIIRLNSVREKRKANIMSITTARLVTVILAIAQSFSGKKQKAQDLETFLPFPLDEDPTGTAAETLQIFKRLVKQKKLPLRVAAGLQKVINT